MAQLTPIQFVYNRGKGLDSRDLRWEGFAVEGVEGLIICRRPRFHTYHATLKQSYQGGAHPTLWAIVHLDSGLPVVFVDSKAVAVAGTQALGPLVKWGMGAMTVTRVLIRKGYTAAELDALVAATRKGGQCEQGT